MNYYDFVSQPRFFSFLLEIDQSIADEAHSKGCPSCGGRLNRANYMRSGYGVPAGGERALQRRFSFCCREDQCRKRKTPESLRFMRGMGYATITVILVSAIHHGLTGERLSALTKNLQVSRQTVSRWIKWWRERFATSRFWKTRLGRLASDLDPQCLPLSLLKAFDGAHSDKQSAMTALLKFLAPYHPD